MSNREVNMSNITDIREMKARITVFGVGGAGGNAVNNMIAAGLQGVDFVVANTDAQALTKSKSERIIQMGAGVTQGLGAGSQPELGRAAAEEAIDAIREHLTGSHMMFVTAGMGGGTGTGAPPLLQRQRVRLAFSPLASSPSHSTSRASGACVLPKHDIFARDITRALLNLISNGFYAATKRNTQQMAATTSRPLRPRQETSVIVWKSGSVTTALVFRLT